MFATHEHEGFWWRAEDDTKKLPGKLVVTRGESELQLLGNFGLELISESATQKVFNPLHLDEPGRIVGESMARQKITLEGHSIGSPGGLSTYRFPWTLVGKVFGADETIAFNEIIVCLSDLDTWAGASGFTVPQPDPKATDGGVRRMFDIRFERPESIGIQLDGGERASVEFGATHSGWTPVPTNVTVTQDTALRLCFAEPHSLHDVARRVGQLRHFFCLAIGRPVSVLSVTGF